MGKHENKQLERQLQRNLDNLAENNRSEGGGTIDRVNND